MKSGTTYAARLKTVYARHRSAVPKPEVPEDMDVLRALSIGILGVTGSEEQAEHAVERLLATMVDWNEVRVSSPAEVHRAAGRSLPDGAKCCQHLLAALQDVFDRENRLSLERLRALGRREARQYLDNLEGVDAYASTAAFLWGAGRPRHPRQQPPARETPIGRSRPPRRHARGSPGLPRETRGRRRNQGVLPRDALVRTLASGYRSRQRQTRDQVSQEVDQGIETQNVVRQEENQDAKNRDLIPPPSGRSPGPTTAGTPAHMYEEPMANQMSSTRCVTSLVLALAMLGGCATHPLAHDRPRHRFPPGPAGHRSHPRPPSAQPDPARHRSTNPRRRCQTSVTAGVAPSCQGRRPGRRRSIHRGSHRTRAGPAIRSPPPHASRRTGLESTGRRAISRRRATTPSARSPPIPKSWSHTTCWADAAQPCKTNREP